MSFIALSDVRHRLGSAASKSWLVPLSELSFDFKVINGKKEKKKVTFGKCPIQNVGVKSFFMNYVGPQQLHLEIEIYTDIAKITSSIPSWINWLLFFLIEKLYVVIHSNMY